MAWISHLLLVDSRPLSEEVLWLWMLDLQPLSAIDASDRPEYTKPPVQQSLVFGR